MLTGHYEQIQDNHSCPSPIARIEVSNPYDSKNKLKNVKAILETGAGVTSIPESIIKELGSLLYTTINVRSPLDRNETIAMRLYVVRIKFDGKLHEVEVLTIPRNYAIIGRDILNQYKITLNGPEETWSIE
jgi:predicted aspartyl protease